MYTAPTLITSGNVVRETRSGSQKNSVEMTQFDKRQDSSGSIGFNL
jgi:hypothetical protein